MVVAFFIVGLQFLHGHRFHDFAGQHRRFAAFFGIAPQQQHHLFQQVQRNPSIAARPVR